MYIEQLYTNCLAQAAYFIESNGEAAIIDPIRDYEIYIAKAKEKNATIKYIFETHFHADFISGHLDLAKATGATIVFGPHAKTAFDKYEAKNGEQFNLGDITLTAMHTPGHTPESTCYLLKDKENIDYCIFTGDTLFVGDVGRPDLLDSNPEMTTEIMAGWLYNSLNETIKKIDNNVIVYPAHGPGSSCGKSLGPETFSTIGEQKKSNYAMQDMSKEEFINAVTMGITPPPSYFFEDAAMNKNGYIALNDIIEKGNNKLSISEFEEEIKIGTFILDTRIPDIFEIGFIPQSINIGLNGQFAIWAASLIELDRRIILVAEQGKELESIKRLARVGFENIVGYLDGGYENWKNANKNIDLIISITPEEFAIDYRFDKNYEVVDVRKPSETEEAVIENAHLIPLSDITQNFDKMDKEKVQYIHCAGGYRSIIACSILKKEGFQKIKNIYGGFSKIKESNVPIVQLTTK